MSIKGNNNSNVLTGTSAAESIYGLGGDDTLSGDDGNDVLIGDGIFTDPVTLVTPNVVGQTLRAGGQMVFSSDGTQVAFSSPDPTTPGAAAIYLKDLTTGIVTTIVPSNTVVGNFSLSADGSKIAFTTTTTHSPADPNNFGSDVYVRDLNTGAYTLVSADQAGIVGNGASSNPQFSPDGTKVLFQSIATNLVTGDTNGVSDIFLKDLNSGVVTRISLGTLDNQGSTASTSVPTGSLNAVFAPDGTKIAFQSDDNSLTDDTPHSNAVAQVYVKNLLNNHLDLESQFLSNATDTVGNGNSIEPRFSPDGTQVIFASSSVNFPGNGALGNFEIYSKSLVNQQFSLQSDLVDASNNVTVANNDSSDPSFSPDGHFILFTSKANNLVSGDTNGAVDIFIKSLSTGEIVLLSQSAAGQQANGDSGALSHSSVFVPGAGNAAVFSPDGSMVAFNTLASNLAANSFTAFNNEVIVTLDLAPFHISSGLSGNDVLDGGPGNDVLAGAAGNDTLFGGAGQDTLNGDDGNDTLVGNADPFASELDTLNGGSGSDILYVELTDTILGGAGKDFVYVVNSNPININLGATSIEWIQSDFGNDTIDGSTQTVGIEVYSDGGNDTITGSAFDDIIWSGSGNDTVTGGDGNDVIVGDIGADSISGGNGNDSLYVDASDTFIDGGAGFDAAYITAGASMTIDLAATHIEFVADFVPGGSDDTIDGSGASANLEVYAGAGTDTVKGGSGNDFLWGEAGNDIVTGGSGNDTLVGGLGADTLTGGPGTDALYGNSGNGGDGAVDTFVFTPNWGTDFVFDFEHNIDKLDLTALGTTFAALTFTNTPDGHCYVSFGSNLIAVANHTTANLTASDFLF